MTTGPSKQKGNKKDVYWVRLTFVLGLSGAFCFLGLVGSKSKGGGGSKNGRTGISCLLT